jgi:hypothetical protein
MKLGAEPKKLAILIGLLLVAAYFLYTNLGSSPSAGSAQPKAHSASVNSAIPEVMPSPEAKTGSARPTVPKRNEQEFRLSFKTKGVDPASIDPKLRLDLLAKVRSVDLGPAARNLFAWGTAAPAALPPGVRDPHPIVPKLPSQGGPGNETTAGSSQPPPPPPITLKYYGYTSQRSDGHKRAFFSEGDCTGATPTAQCDIFIAAEGDLILKRFKVVRIGVSSAEVEDTQFNHTQPLPITQESPG